jgi:hypothetical protein
LETKLCAGQSLGLLQISLDNFRWRFQVSNTGHILPVTITSGSFGGKQSEELSFLLFAPTCKLTRNVSWGKYRLSSKNISLNHKLTSALFNFGNKGVTHSIKMILTAVFLFVKVTGCGNPGNIPHGRFSGVDFSVGSRVVYRCLSGYKMKGKTSRRCKANGKWTRVPVCQRGDFF